MDRKKCDIMEWTQTSPKSQPANKKSIDFHKKFRKDLCRKKGTLKRPPQNADLTGNV